VICDNWKTVAVDRLPLDEQELWAEHAAERAQPKDLEKLARVLVAVPREARMVFFAKCAAENRHRQLRLEALRDLAQSGPGTNLFEQAVRLVERAPTWRQDRQQGSRTLLLALGDGFGEASDHYVSAWAWRLAASSGDAQQRRVITALEGGRDLVRSLSGRSGDAARQQAKAIVAIAEEQPLDVGSALLACIRTVDLGAERVLEDARIRMSADPRALAAALGSNVPLPRGVKRPTRSRVSAAALQGSVLPSSIGALPNEAAHEEPKKRRRRRKRKRTGESPHGEATVEAVDNDAPEASEVEVSPAPMEVEDSAPVKPKRGRPRKVRPEENVEAPAVEAPAVEAAPVGQADEAPVKRKRGRPRKVQPEADQAVEAPSVESTPTDVVEDAPAKPKRGRPRKVKVEEPVVEAPPAPEFTASGMRRVVIDDEPAGTTFSTDGMNLQRGRGRPRKTKALPKSRRVAPPKPPKTDPPGPAEIPEW
jgi:hypothetical protein